MIIKLAEKPLLVGSSTSDNRCSEANYFDDSEFHIRSQLLSIA